MMELKQRRNIIKMMLDYILFVPFVLLYLILLYLGYSHYVNVSHENQDVEFFTTNENDENVTIPTEHDSTTYERPEWLCISGWEKTLIACNTDLKVDIQTKSTWRFADLNVTNTNSTMVIRLIVLLTAFLVASCILVVVITVKLNIRRIREKNDVKSEEQQIIISMRLQRKENTLHCRKSQEEGKKSDLPKTASLRKEEGNGESDVQEREVVVDTNLAGQSEESKGLMLNDLLEMLWLEKVPDGVVSDPPERDYIEDCHYWLSRLETQNAEMNMLLDKLDGNVKI